MEKRSSRKAVKIAAQEPAMPSTETSYEHIVLDGTEPTLAGTTFKVKDLVAQSLANGWSPEELHFQHPSLSMGMIHSALAFYWDHREAIDREIQGDLESSDRLRSEIGPETPLRRRLRDQGLLGWR
jgi:uncharacterized protein (DUF433 family)